MEGEAVEEGYLRADINCWIDTMEEEDRLERHLEERIMEEAYVADLVVDSIEDVLIADWIVDIEEEEARLSAVAARRSAEMEAAERDGRFAVRAKLLCDRRSQGLQPGSEGPLDLKCHHCMSAPCFTDVYANIVTSYWRRLENINLTQREKRALMYSRLVDCEKACLRCNGGKKLIPRCIAYEVIGMFPGKGGNYLLL